MRRILKYVLFVFAGIILGAAAMFLALNLMNDTDVENFLNIEIRKTDSDVTSKNEELITLAYDVVECINSADYKALASYVHPEYGVVFCPYSTINFSSDKCFTATEVAAFGTNTDVHVWGTMDGSGFPIEMTVSEYFARFVANADYCAAPRVGVNYIVTSGNALENVTEVFAEADFVDLNFPGTEENSYIDWSTLRLVFEDYNGQKCLTAIIHCEWTI